MFLLSLAVLLQVATNTNYTNYTPAPGLSGTRVYLESLVFIPDSGGAVAIDGTNYITVSFKNGSTTLGSFTTNTGGTALVAGTAVPITLSGSDREFVALTGALTIDSVKAGTGAVLKGTVVATWRVLR